MPPTIKAIHIAFALSIVLLVFSRVQSYKLPDPPDILPQTYEIPIQTETDDIPLNPQRKDGEAVYDVRPLFNYEMHGLVVSRHLSKNDFGESHAAWGDFINTVDLCVIWGDNIRSKVYQRINFWSGDTACEVDLKFGTKQEEWDRFLITDVSNNHLLAGNLNVEQTIADIKPGDQIYLKGKLVEYKRKNDTGPYRRSSTVRTDFGCEIIYVTSAKILKSGNALWRWFYVMAKILVFAHGAFLAVYYLRLKDIIFEMINGRRAAVSLDKSGDG
jgi:hypothetical protein